MNNFNISNFEKETKLRIINNYDGRFLETSGKSYAFIKKAINKYNLQHSCHITCYDNKYKDCTYIII